MAINIILNLLVALLVFAFRPGLGQLSVVVLFYVLRAVSNKTKIRPLHGN